MRLKKRKPPEGGFPKHVFLDWLVFGNIRDRTHGAIYQAVTARDAVILIHNGNGASGDIKNTLRAGINADSATYAFVLADDRMSHRFLLDYNFLLREELQTTPDEVRNPVLLYSARYHYMHLLQ